MTRGWGRSGLSRECTIPAGKPYLVLSAVLGRLQYEGVVGGKGGENPQRVWSVVVSCSLGQHGSLKVTSDG